MADYIVAINENADILNHNMVRKLELPPIKNTRAHQDYDLLFNKFENDYKSKRISFEWFRSISIKLAQDFMSGELYTYHNNPVQYMYELHNHVSLFHPNENNVYKNMLCN